MFGIFKHYFSLSEWGERTNRKFQIISIRHDKYPRFAKQTSSVYYCNFLNVCTSNMERNLCSFIHFTIISALNFRLGP